MARMSLNRIISGGDIKELRELLGKRKRVNVEDNLGWSPLHTAVKKNRKDIVELLLNHTNFEVNCCTRKGCTSLWLACDLPNLDLDIARDILNHGADPNIPNNTHISPLHLACKRKNFELVKLLILHHANVNNQGLNDHTPLHCAIEHDSLEIVEYLLAHDVNANLTEIHGLNALMFTIYLQRSYSALLIPYTQNLDAVTHDGWTALLLAINLSNFTVARALIERGASLTAQKCGYPTLELAVMSQDFDLFKLVWQHSNLKIVSGTDDFMRFVCRYCPLPYFYKHYELILNAYNLDFHLEGATGLFANIFEYEPTIEVSSESTKSQYLNVIGWILDRNVQLDMADMEKILLYFVQCPYAIDLWKMIFAKTTPNINQEIVAKAIYRNYDVALLMVTYCLHMNPEKVIVFQHGTNDTFCRSWLALFTPTSKYRYEITHHSCRLLRDRAIKILSVTKQIKSLLELSRDTIREAMRGSCNTTQDFLVALEKLHLPTYLTDVVRLRIPVNKYLLQG